MSLAAILNDETVEVIRPIDDAALNIQDPPGVVMIVAVTERKEEASSSMKNKDGAKKKKNNTKRPDGDARTIRNPYKNANSSPHRRCACGLFKHVCRKCSPQNFCDHGRRHYTCQSCRSLKVCEEHNQRRDRCLQCRILASSASLP